MAASRLTVVLVCYYIAGQATAQSAEDTANSAAKTPCTLNAYYRAIESKLTSWINDAAAAPQKLKMQLNELQLAALKHAGTTKGVSYTVLAAIIRRRQAGAITYTQTAVPKFAAAIELVATKRAETLVLTGAATTKRTSTVKHEQATAELTKVLMQGTGNNNVGCKVTTTATILTQTNCISEATDVTNAKKIADNLKDMKKMAIIKQTAMTLPEVTALIEARGTINNPSQWLAGTSATHCEQNASPQGATEAQHAVAAQKIRLTAKAKPTVETLAELAQAKEHQAHAGSTDTTALLTSDSDLATALTAATTAQREQPGTLATNTLEALAGEPEARNMYNFMRQSTGAGSNKTPTAKEVANLVFGTATGTVDKAFLQPLSTDAVSIPTTDSDIKTTIKEIAVQEGFEQAMAYYYVQNMQKLTKAVEGVKKEEKEKADATEKTEEKKDGEKKEECTGTVETDCDKTKCTWNKEKNECKVKESAYISSVTKAPLLLAVLLL
uniref:Variant surface glycoprotein 1125.265 n=1 Tax=Trypanosoma brucei TaxID=5691 RepID=A0A1J0R5J5_9TRYP|nr:variant surface glycoprotein 1125.265 [Trypanosoma brucei]